MQMFKIVLADDDSRFVAHFKKITEWEKYEMEVVAVFDNGDEVIKYIEDNPVDAVITDISMPEISGIDIAKYVYENNPYIKVMFFSAYRNFRYAQEAFDYGVVGYIVKPISIEELDKKLERLKNLFHEKNTEEFMDDLIIRKRSEFVLNFLGIKKVHKQVLKRIIDDSGLPYRFVYLRCCIVTFELQDFESYVKNDWKNEIDVLYEAINRIVCYENDNLYCIPVRIFKSELTILFAFKKQNLNLAEVLNTIKMKLNESLTINAAETDIMEADTFAKMYELIKECQSPYAEKINSLITNDNVNNTDEYIEKIKKYIEDNYFRDITLNEIADEMHMNAVAFSRFFKNHMGEKFINYLNRIRVEKAKQMIIMSEDNINELYEKCGYPSKAHFFKNFRYYTGMTPMEYRKRHMETGEKR